MEAWITDLMEQFGYSGIFLMMLIENIFPPIPSEVILPFGGFMTTYTHLSVLGVVITSTTGSILGAIILYGIGMLIDGARMEKVVARFGHVIRVKKEDIQKVDHWFNHYGYWTVLFCRMIPLVRSIISIPAGMYKMTFWIFLLFTMIGTFIWNLILISLGVFLGASWQNILGFMAMYSTVVYVFIVIGVALIIILFIRNRKNKK